MYFFFCHARVVCVENGKAKRKKFGSSKSRTIGVVRNRKVNAAGFPREMNTCVRTMGVCKINNLKNKSNTMDTEMIRFVTYGIHI